MRREQPAFALLFFFSPSDLLSVCRGNSRNEGTRVHSRVCVRVPNRQVPPRPRVIGFFRPVRQWGTSHMLLGSSLSLEFSSSSRLVHRTDAKIYGGSRAISLNDVLFLHLGRAASAARVFRIFQVERSTFVRVSRRVLNSPLHRFPRFRDMLPLNCQNNAGNVIGSSVSNGESIQSLQSIDSNGTNLAMSPLSTMSMSPVAVNPCSPMGMSPMAPRHPRYATPMVSSSVHTTHPHSGGLSPMNDVKALCYGRGICETGKLSFSSILSSIVVTRMRSKYSRFR